MTFVGNKKQSLGCLENSVRNGRRSRRTLKSLTAGDLCDEFVVDAETALAEMENEISEKDVRIY